MLTSLIGFIFSLHHTTRLIKNLAKTISSLANHQQAQGMLSESLVTHHPLSSVPYPQLHLAGRLERSRVFGETRECSDCHKRLNSKSSNIHSNACLIH